MPSKTLSSSKTGLCGSATGARPMTPGPVRNPAARRGLRSFDVLKRAALPHPWVIRARRSQGGFLRSTSSQPVNHMPGTTSRKSPPSPLATGDRHAFRAILSSTNLLHHCRLLHSRACPQDIRFSLAAPRPTRATTPARISQRHPYRLARPEPEPALLSRELHSLRWVPPCVRRLHRLALPALPRSEPNRHFRCPHPIRRPHCHRSSRRRRRGYCRLVHVHRRWIRPLLLVRLSLLL